jgi:hypothetical protein
LLDEAYAWIQGKINAPGLLPVKDLPVEYYNKLRDLLPPDTQAVHALLDKAYSWVQTKLIAAAPFLVKDNFSHSHICDTITTTLVPIYRSCIDRLPRSLLGACIDFVQSLTKFSFDHSIDFTKWTALLTKFNPMSAFTRLYRGFSSASEPITAKTSATSVLHKMFSAVYDNDVAGTTTSQKLIALIAFTVLVSLLAHPRGVRLLITFFHLILALFFPQTEVRASMFEMKSRMRVLDIGDMLKTRDKYGSNILFRVYGTSKSPWLDAIRNDLHGLMRDVWRLLTIAFWLLVDNVPWPVKVLFWPVKVLFQLPMKMFAILQTLRRAYSSTKGYKTSRLKTIACLCVLTGRPVPNLRTHNITFAVRYIDHNLLCSKAWVPCLPTRLGLKCFLPEPIAVFANDYLILPIKRTTSYLCELVSNVTVAFSLILRCVAMAPITLFRRSVGVLLRATTVMGALWRCFPIRFRGFAWTPTNLKTLADFADLLITFISLIPFLILGFLYQAYLLIMVVRMFEKVVSTSLFAKISVAQPVM